MDRRASGWLVLRNKPVDSGDLFSIVDTMKFILDLEVLGLLWQIDTHLQTVCVGHSVGAEPILWGSQIRQEIAVAFGAGYGVISEHNSAVAKMRLNQFEGR